MDETSSGWRQAMRHHPHEFRNIQILGAARGQQLREVRAGGDVCPGPISEDQNTYEPRKS